MGTINEKLDYLQATKELIKEAIINKGQTVNNDDAFRTYADKINNIETGITIPEYFMDYLFYDDDKAYTVKQNNLNYIEFLKSQLPKTISAVNMFSLAELANHSGTSGIDPNYLYELFLNNEIDFSALQNASKMFYRAKNTNTGIIYDPSLITTEQLKDISYMFASYLVNSANNDGLFYDGTNKKYIFPNFNTSGVENASYLFAYDANTSTKRNIDFSNNNYNLSNCSNFNYMFQQCNMGEVPQFFINSIQNSNVEGASFLGLFTRSDVSDITLTFNKKVSGISSLANTCTNLKNLDLTFTDEIQGFSNATSLITGDIDLETIKLTNLKMNRGSSAYIDLYVSGTASKAIKSIIFNNCDFSGARIYFQNGQIDRTAYLDMVNSLPTADSSVSSSYRTITLTGNPCASELTDEDVALATAKNYIVVK